ncbi:unnamed protein product [Cuscuta europaea]|uniref:Uncharacterized protein n=1 Tax=Cuscuta europaea TaxID=41803 RepID=A0A9P0ZHZ7_CUSEU|nr:unnamed protein product [Cuscuta europaea]
MNTLDELEILAMMLQLGELLGMSKIFGLKYNPNDELVYEFLGSVERIKYDNDDREDKLTFRLFNKSHSITKREFAEHFGLPVPPQNAQEPDTGYGFELWKKMTGEMNFSSKNLVITHVQHPVLRIFLKYLVSFVFGRPNNHQARIGDICILANAVFDIPPFHYNIVNRMWEHLYKECTAQGKNWIGGVILHIATKFGYVDNAPIAEFCLFDITHLGNSKDIKFSHRDYKGKIFYKWSIFPKPTRYFTIPSEGLPTIPFRLEPPLVHHYCLPPAIPPYFQNQEDEPAQEQAPPILEDIPAPPHDQPHYDPYQTQVLENQRALLEGLRDLSFRVNRMDEDNRRAIAPIYAYHHQQGHFSSMRPPVQHPSWYDPSQWGNFGEDSGYSGGDYGGGQPGFDGDEH